MLRSGLKEDENTDHSLRKQNADMLVRWAMAAQMATLLTARWEFR